MKTIINMTPHPVNIIDAEGKEITTIASAGTIRLQASIAEAGHIAGIRTTRTIFGDPEGLPEKAANTFFIVSQLVKSALPSRDDLLVPAEVVRDDSGMIIGCRSLGR